jgi:hypothetical protein
LTFFAILTPASFEPAALIKQSQETTQLDADNADNWTTIPGPNNIQVTWSHTLYNVTNPSFVSTLHVLIFLGEQPVPEWLLSKRASLASYGPVRLRRGRYLREPAVR